MNTFTTGLIVVACCAASSVFAWPGGAPKCGVSEPGHGTDPSNLKDLRIIADKTRSAVPAHENRWIITVNRPDNIIKGLLLRPQAAFSGKFVGYNATAFQDLEEGSCVTHVDNDPTKKQGTQMFEFQADSDAEPIFDLFVVGEQKEQWWKTQV